MPIFLKTTEPDFEARFQSLLGMKRESDSDVDAIVAEIIADVAERGDAAVIELTAKFDHLKLTPETLAFSKAEIDAAVATVPPPTERLGLRIIGTFTFSSNTFPFACSNPPCSRNSSP